MSDWKTNESIRRAVEKLHNSGYVVVIVKPEDVEASGMAQRAFTEELTAYTDQLINKGAYTIEPREDGFNSDAEADADVLRSAGWGQDEDYRPDGDF